MFIGIPNFIAEHWLALLIALSVVHAVSIALTILSERREPAATLAWILSVFFLPVIGVVAYYLLARNRFRRQFRAKMQVNQQADDALSMYVYERLSNFDESTLSRFRPVQQNLLELAANSAQTHSGGPAFPDNKVTVFFDAAEKYASLKEAISSAKEHINFQYFIFRGDEVGREVRDRLIERAKAGVEVRVLFDGIGTRNTFPRHFFDGLKEAGGEVAVFLPLRFSKIVEQVNFRNHRKIVVIDGKSGFVGGMNIGNEYLGLHPKIGKWQDAHVKIEGPAVCELQRIFLTDWLFATEQSLAEPRFFPIVDPAGDELVQIVASGPDCHWPTIQQLYFQAIATATKEVLIATPYFIPDASLLMAMETAALRGVNVKIILPSVNDQRFVTSAGRSYYEELLQAGVRIYEFHDGFLHAKTLAIDGRYGSIGSANMDVRSFTLNFEVSAFVHSEKFVQTLKEQFERNIIFSEEIELDAFLMRPQGRKLRESFAQLLSGVL